MKLAIPILLSLLIIFGVFCQSLAQINPANTTEIKDSKAKNNKGEKIFIKHADKSMAIIEQSALRMSINGVMIIAYILGEVTSTWISKIKVVGTLTNKDSKSDDQDVAVATEGMDYLYQYFPYK